MGYGLIAPFLPIELDKEKINTELFGYIFGSYSLAVIIFSPIVGKLLITYQKRKVIFQIGMICMSISMFGFPLLPRLVGKKYLVAGYIAIRFV